MRICEDPEFDPESVLFGFNVLFAPRGGMNLNYQVLGG